MTPVLAFSGFMGSGKSSVGRSVAERLGCRFVDLDEEIESRLGCTIADVFLRDGELGFRQVETRVLKELLLRSTSECVVMSLGGGTVTTPGAVEALREKACVIWLKVDPVAAWERVKESDRPLATGRQAFLELSSAREGAYAETADLAIDTAGRTPTEVADEVLRLTAHLQPCRGAQSGDGGS